jgi:multiple sugar transport system permease protein
MKTGYSKYVLSFLMLVVSILMAFPFMLMLLTALKTMPEIMSPGFIFIPERLVWGNFIEAMTRGNWPRYFLNSFIVTAISVIVSLVINSLAGYAFSRLRFTGRDILFLLTLIGLMIPPQVVMLPVFVILRYAPLAGGNNILGQGGIGFLDSYTGLVAPFLAGSFGVFLFRQFFLNFPRALDDAARIDGLGRVRTFIRIYVPLSTPVFGTLIALRATRTWNDFIWPLVITYSDEMRTVQLALQVFKTETTVEWNLLMAATALTIMPLVITFLSVQRFFIQGIVTTGIKG